MSRRRKFLGLALLLALLALAHIWYWYLPRERPAEPSWSDLTGRLLAGEPVRLTKDAEPESYPLALWIPYPHQNLGAAVKDLGGLEQVAAGLAGLAGQELMPLPTFGPLPVPPARELVVATDREGGRFLVAARVYPAVTVLARLAGKLAGNPWLAGGRWQAGARELEVRWQGTLWTVTAVDSPSQVPADPASLGFPRGLPVPADRTGSSLGNVDAATGTLLGALRLDRAWGPLPDGFFSLIRETAAQGGSSLVVSNHAADPYPEGVPEERRPVHLLERGVALAAYGEESGAPRPSQALVLFEAPPAGSDDFGGAALYETVSEGSSSVSGVNLGLAILLGQDAFRGRAAGWSVSATGKKDYRRAVDLAGNLREFRRAWRAGGPPRLSQSLALRPRSTRRAVGRLTDALAKVVPEDHPDLLRARGLEALLGSFEGFDLATLVVTESRSTSDARAGRPVWAELCLSRE